MNSRLLMISPVRNEGAHIRRVVRAVAAQELLPADWIVVDDCSTDGTLEALFDLRDEAPFMRVLAGHERRPGASVDRLAGGAAPRGFNRGLATVDWRSYTHIMKLDGDIELAPWYLRVLLERFDSEPRLGIAGGVLDEPTESGAMRRVRIPAYHVHGALKCYTRECFEAIGGVEQRLGWDTIDETYARMRGYVTRSFDDLVSVHHRPCGTADGALRGRARHGECAYISHYPPMWVTLRAFKVAGSRPRVLSGVAFLFGYVRAAVRGIERVPDTAFRRFTRHELRHRMMQAVVPQRFTPPQGG